MSNGCITKYLYPESFNQLFLHGGDYESDPPSEEVGFIMKDILLHHVDEDALIKVVIFNRISVGGLPHWLLINLYNSVGNIRMTKF